MVAYPNFNPYVTTNASGTFLTSEGGGFQGTAMDDPAVRNYLAGGVLGPNETLPMWGGVAISETTTPVGSTPNTLYPNSTLGGYITRATTVTATSSGGVTGFSVFNQAHAMINTPQSPVPLAFNGMTVSFYRLGSGARIWVACEPDLVTQEGLIISNQVSWDFNDQLLQPYVASGATETISSLTWSATNGGQVAVVMASASIYGLGDTINLSGATNTGSGSLSLLNTTHVINTYTDTTHFTFLLPGTSAIWGTLAGSPVLNVGVGALNVRVLDVQPTNSMTVNYNPVTGNAGWNYNGSAALILI